MRRYTVRINDVEHVVDVEETARDRFVVHLGDRVVDVALVAHEDAQIASVEIGTVGTPAAAPGVPAAPRPAASGSGLSTVTAPMPGVVLSVAVTPGAVVTRGQLLLVLEAMKMKNDIRADRDGVIASVSVAAGDQVRHGDTMVAFEG